MPLFSLIDDYFNAKIFRKSQRFVLREDMDGRMDAWTRDKKGGWVCVFDMLNPAKD